MFPIRDNIPSRTVPVVNSLLIMTCAMVFLMQLAAARLDGRGGDLVERYGMIPVRVLHPRAMILIPEEHVVETPLGYERFQTERRLPRPPFNPWWTLVTCFFLHGGWLHIIGNMWFLYIFGDNVEDRLGHFKYLVFYLLCGLAGSVAHLVSNWNSPLPTVGASGAIAGVMGAYFILYPRARVLTLLPIFIFFTLIDVPAPLFLGFWFLLQFLQGVAPAATGGVAWWAHIGGFAVGVALALSARRTRMIRPAVERTITLPRGAWHSRRGWE